MVKWLFVVPVVEMMPVVEVMEMFLTFVFLVFVTDLLALVGRAVCPKSSP